VFLWLPSRHSLLDAVAVCLPFLDNPRHMCRITFNPLTSSELSSVLMMRYTLLALDEFCYHRQPLWLHFIASLSMLWMKLALLLVLCSTLKYYCLICQVCREYCSTSWNSWHSDTSRHHRSFLVSMLILTGIPMCKQYCLDSVLLATLLLWS
jgi:hypothetical protein